MGVDLTFEYGLGGLCVHECLCMSGLVFNSYSRSPKEFPHVTILGWFEGAPSSLHGPKNLYSATFHCT